MIEVRADGIGDIVCIGAGRSGRYERDAVRTSRMIKQKEVIKVADGGVHVQGACVQYTGHIQGRVANEGRQIVVVCGEWSIRNGGRHLTVLRDSFAVVEVTGGMRGRRARQGREAAGAGVVFAFDRV